MKKLKIIYFSNAFIADHGGRLHSEAFLKEANLNKDVFQIEPYPKPSVRSTEQKKVLQGGYRKRFKNNSLLQILFFYRRNLKSFKEISKLLRNEFSDFNVLHIRVDSNFLIIPRLKKAFPHLIITTEVNASPFDENFNNIGFVERFKKMESNSLEASDANFFVSNYLKDSIMVSSSGKRDFVVHNGVALESFPTKEISNLENRNLVFGYVGTLDYHKNLFNLIDAFKETYEKYDHSIKLKIFGDGPMYNELSNYIKSLGLSTAVELKGWIVHSEVAANLKNIDIAIHHSANPYMSPLKIFEYMAVGVSVIGPDIPAVREIFEDKKEIILVENTTEDLVSKMSYLIENREKRNEIAKTGNIKVRESFGWDSNALNIINVMKSKLNENN